MRAFLEAKLSGVTLLLVGAGALENDLRRLASESPLIRIAPFQNQRAMPRVYAAADLVVLPSEGRDETWGFAIHEAMACGKPVVASDHVGCHGDLIVHRRNGLVVRAGDRRALTEALREAFHQLEQLRGWGEESLKIVSRFSYREATQGLHAALEAVAPGRRRDPLRRIHLWVPEFLGAGGIQQHSRTFTRALAELLPGAGLRVLSKNDRTRQCFPSAKLSHHTIRRGGIFRTARFGAFLLWQTLTQRPDLVIVTHLHFAPLACALKKIVGLRYWVTAHGIEAWSVRSILMRRSLSAAEKILCVSRHTRDRLLQNSTLDLERVFVLANAIDERDFTLAAKPPHLLRRYGLQPTQKVIFTLSRLDSRERSKGYDLVVDAMPRLRESIPDIHYVLAGCGHDSDRIRRRVRDLGLRKNVTLTGFLPERDLRDHYSLCDLFVMPSRSEGFGIVYLEALAAGRPVLAGNRDGSRDPLLDGELGALVDPENSEQLAAAVTEILLGRAPARFYRPSYLRSRVVEEFGFDAFKSRLLDLLNT